jgi:hypothetical protein
VCETRQKSSQFGRRLFKTRLLRGWIYSPDKPREVPHFTQVASEQSARLVQCSLIVATIDDMRRARNTPVVAKLVDTINCHGAPEAQQTISAVRAPDDERAVARNTLRLWRVPRLPTVIIRKCLRQISGEATRGRIHLFRRAAPTQSRNRNVGLCGAMPSSESVCRVCRGHPCFSWRHAKDVDRWKTAERQSARTKIRLRMTAAIEKKTATTTA